jgi:hypothetical protein
MMVTSIPELQVEHESVYRGCTLRKNTKGSYPSSDIRSKGILDLVHSDVCEPLTVSSLGGSTSGEVGGPTKYQNLEGVNPQDPVGRSILPGQFIREIKLQRRSGGAKEGDGFIYCTYLKRVSWLRGRADPSEGVPPQD